MAANTTLPDTYTTMTADVTTITTAGSYYFQGTDFTTVTVTLAAAGDVIIYLDGATFTADGSVAIEVDDDYTENLYIVLLNNTTNTVTSTKNAIKSTANVYITGSGTLNITSTGKSCVNSDADVYVQDVTLNLTASATEDGNGLTGTKVVTNGATINVLDAGKDGIHAEADDSVTAFTKDTGYVLMEDTTFTYTYVNDSTDTTDADTGSGDGIQADTLVLIDNSNLDITTGSEMIAYSADLISSGDYVADDFKYGLSGSTYYKVDSEQRGTSGTYAIVNSCKGIRVGTIEYDTTTTDSSGNETTTSTEVTSSTGTEYTIQITDSTLVFDTFDDSVHANYGQVIMDGCTMTAATYDQALSADGQLLLKNNTITITSSYEGMQGSVVAIYGSTSDINVTATDDGINASSDYFTSNLYVSINGGQVNVLAGGDGIDSNGYAYYNAGTIDVEASTANDNSPLDTTSGYYMNGATIFASGSSGMVESPQTDSTAYTIMVGTTYSAGATFTLKDSDGNTVMTKTSTKSGGAIILSSPDITSGETYTFYLGSTSVGSATVSSKVTTIGTISSNNGGEIGGGQGGPGGDTGWRP